MATYKTYLPGRFRKGDADSWDTAFDILKRKHQAVLWEPTKGEWQQRHEKNHILIF